MKSAVIILGAILVVNAGPALAAPPGGDPRVLLRGDLRRIEEVRWRHRIWPADNPGPKPPLADVLPDAAIEARAARAGACEKVLGSVFHRPLEGAQIQREIDRAARDTKDPGMLRELWAALDDDPGRVAAALAAPALAEHLARSWYASDPEIHAGTRARAERERGGCGGAGAVQRASRTGDPERFEAALAFVHTFGDGTLHEDSDRFFQVRRLVETQERVEAEVCVWPKAPFDEWLSAASARAPRDEALTIRRLADTPFRLPALAAVTTAPADDSWSPIAFTPLARSRHVALWTGAEMLFWGGYGFGTNAGAYDDGATYDPALDRFRPVSGEHAPEGRVNHTAVWTGTEMIVWGGRAGGGPAYQTGGRYNPITDSWKPTALLNAPAGREGHTAVWTGGQMIVWGGSGATLLRDGGRYDPVADAWTSSSLSGAPSARSNHTAVWSGSRMIVWGGAADATGGRYDPVADAWTPTSISGAPQPRSQHRAIWTGTEMIVWGGAQLSTGGRYNPATDTWRPTSTAGAPLGRRGHTMIWTGTQAIVWGGCADVQCNLHQNTGGRYDPAADAWTSTSTATAPYGRSFHDAVWTGREMIAWGGCIGGECEFPDNTGGRYSPATDSWVPTFRPTPPKARLMHTSVWTGSEMIIWGGYTGLPERTGGRYEPATDTWLPMAFSPGGIDARDAHTAVWTGTEMIIWGGSAYGLGATSSGGRYAPASDSWTIPNQADAPEAREQQVAVWTGSRMIVWGGIDAGRRPLRTGGRYDPSTDSWQPMTTPGAPSGSWRLPAVWSGREMLVWGGLDSGLLPTSSGGRYDPALDRWTAIPSAGAPSARSDHVAVWSGDTLVVWGGMNDADVLSTGGRFSPATGAWQPVALTGAPGARQGHTAVWTGAEMVVWGGCVDRVCAGLDPHPRDAARYAPAADTWRPVTPFRQPTPRSAQTAVWTGSRMLVWGGWKGTVRLDTGGAYVALPPGASSPGEAGALSVSPAPDGVSLDLAWEPSCTGEATDYEVMEGTIGAWTSHEPVLCSTGGATAARIVPSPGPHYYLVVPRTADAEGSYGADSAGLERPRSSNACVAAQVPATCP